MTKKSMAKAYAEYLALIEQYTREALCNSRVAALNRWERRKYPKPGKD